MKDEEKTNEQLILELKELREKCAGYDRQSSQEGRMQGKMTPPRQRNGEPALGDDFRVEQAELIAEDAEDRALVAEKARNIAKKARDVAEKARDIAEESRRFAEKSRAIAEKALTASEYSNEELEEALLDLAKGRDNLNAAQEELQSKFDTAVHELEAMGLVRNGLAQQLKVRQEDLRKANEELKVFAAKLERSNAELQDFAFVASHDLQEPLRKIQSFATRLKSKCSTSLGEEGCDYLHRMERAANRMSSLLSALLAYSRVATRVTPYPPIELGRVAEDAVSDFEMALEDADAQVEIGEMPTMEADPDQIRQLLQNLIGNALKYRRKDERIHIRVYGSADNGVGQIFVEDNGIGFDEKYLDRIFKPLQQLHGRNAYDGTGMGLAICRKIVERHGWTITARSTPGKGSTFIVTLPVPQTSTTSTEGEPSILH